MNKDDLTMWRCALVDQLKHAGALLLRIDDVDLDFNVVVHRLWTGFVVFCTDVDNQDRFKAIDDLSHRIAMRGQPFLMVYQKHESLITSGYAQLVSPQLAVKVDPNSNPMKPSIMYALNGWEGKRRAFRDGRHFIEVAIDICTSGDPNGILELASVKFQDELIRIVDNAG